MAKRKKNPAAVLLGALGGKRRWKGKTKQERAAEMQRVALARWSNAGDETRAAKNP